MTSAARPEATPVKVYAFFRLPAVLVVVVVAVAVGNALAAGLSSSRRTLARTGGAIIC